MADGRKNATRVVCPSCRKRVARDKAKTTKNWVVYPADCPHCGFSLLNTLAGLGLALEAAMEDKHTAQVIDMATRKRTRNAGTRPAAPEQDLLTGVKKAVIDGEMPKNKGGRPSKLTQELIDTAAGLIIGGAYTVVVARALGISETLWYQWLDRGRQAAQKPKKKHTGIDDLCIQFERVIDQADALAEVKLGMGPSMGILGWQGQAWTMERKWPDRWGRTRSEAPTGGGLTELVDAIAEARASQKVAN